MTQSLSFVVLRLENQGTQEIKGQRVDVANTDPKAHQESLAQEACKETEGSLDWLGHRGDQYVTFNHLNIDGLIKVYYICHSNWISLY